MRCNVATAWGCRISCARICATSATRSCRSEEHTSELQSKSNLVCRLLLENKALVIPGLRCVHIGLPVSDAAGGLERAPASSRMVFRAGERAARLDPRAPLVLLAPDLAATL